MEVCQTADDRFALCEDHPLNPKRFELVPAHPIGVGAQRDLDEGNLVGIDGTPSIFLNGVLVDNLDALEQAIATERKNR